MAARGHITHPSASPGRSGRAAPLAAPERRAAIIEATIPLLREHGLNVTTRRIAEAANVAEGTIFSVFPDKHTLLASAVDAALAPHATVDALEAIAIDIPLESRLEHAVATLQSHFAASWRLLAAVGRQGPAPRPPQRNEAFVHFGPPLAALLQPAASALSVAPGHAARVLLALTLGCTMPPVVEEPLPPGDIVALFLDGVRRS